MADEDEVRCPDGHRLIGELDAVPGIAGVSSVVEVGGELAIEWNGNTDIDWNCQEPILRPDESGAECRVFVCESDEEWLESELVRPQSLGLS
jgi:hypothetical protein